MTSIQDEFQALYSNQKMLIILVFSLITVVVWVTISIITSQRSSTVEPELKVLGTPLNPSINTEVLSQIEQRRTFSDQELSNFPIYLKKVRQPGESRSTLAPSPLPTATASPAARISQPSLQLPQTATTAAQNQP